jgi:CRP-like cAMP-binding protein
VRQIDDLLRDAPPFAQFSDDELERLAGCGVNVAFQPGALLLREGAPADRFFLLRHGSVALETYAPGRGAILIETLGAGDVLGWSWLFAPYRWHFDARARDAVRATAFDAACLRAKCDADPALGRAVMTRFAEVLLERLQATRLRLLDVYGAGVQR